MAKARAKKDQQVDPDRGADDAGATPDVDAAIAADPGHVGVTLLVDDDSLTTWTRARRPVVGLRDGGSWRPLG